MAGLPNQAPEKVDDVNQLVKLAEDVLDHKSMEFLPFGGRMPLSASNRERLDWFADQLVKERKARSLRLSPTVAIKSMRRVDSMPPSSLGASLRRTSMPPSSVGASLRMNSMPPSVGDESLRVNSGIIPPSEAPVAGSGSSRLFALAD